MEEVGPVYFSRLPRFLPALAVALALVFPAPAPALEAPGEARLSADRMRFDFRNGDFLADGNVVIESDGLVIRAARGRGNVNDKEVRFEEGIAASGVWRGEGVNITAGSIELFFAQTPTCIADGGVSGDVGKLSVDADKLYMKGPDLAARNVRLLEDREMDVSFGAGSVNGTLLNGVLTNLTAEKDVWLRGRPNSAGDAVDIRGDKAVYSQERGSVVLSGNVRAVQKGRTLAAQSLVYFPENNRIDAIGGTALGGEEDEPGPARITIDLNLEKRRENR
jgi:lipopolysaccharide export system protein LptA